MPITKSAVKKVRIDKRRRIQNLFWKKRIKRLVKDFKTACAEKSEKSQKLFVSLQKVLDKAAKRKNIHKNKANRLKSRFARSFSVNQRSRGHKTQQA